jgi:hypothetical protein
MSKSPALQLRARIRRRKRRLEAGLVELRDRVPVGKKVVETAGNGVVSVGDSEGIIVEV